ncbi:MAG: indole-3-glycerol-phosphate synthase [Pelagibacteraceae bacterium]|nr:indole-3-glycerol-phosphate synthase [Pelagibacteraceae bacterium]
MSNVLEKIVNQKKIDLLNVKKKYTNNLLNSLIKQNKSYIDFKNRIADNIKQNKISVIAEIKKASPSAGLIIKQYNPVAIAENYILNGAACLSILTEEKFFLGDLQHITDVKNKFKIPILCKDFFIDSYQVPLAKSFGADAILIILSGVDNKLAMDLYQTANELNVTSIVEVHTPDEAEKALNFDKAIIGINNRNLKDLKTDIKTTLQLYKILSSHSCPIISESGIKSEKDVKEIIDKTGIMNFLIGESLLENIEGTSLLKKIVKLTNKISTFSRL